MTALLLAGGLADPNLKSLADHATKIGVSLIDVRGAPGQVPSLHFNPATGDLVFEGANLAPKAAFLRADVFTKNAPQSYQHGMSGLLAMLRGWAARDVSLRVFNTDPFGRSKSVNKAAALTAASALGFAIPETRIGNHKATLSDWLEGGAALIQKPVTGGDLCRALDLTMLAKHSAIPPVIAQDKVPGVDLRVFRVGARFISFELHSPLLDYRDDTKALIVPVETPQKILARLQTLTDQMGLTWSATDFKCCPDRGLVYLETNANPMFYGFNRAADGALVHAMFEALGLV
ncbi:MAG: hypothetical protein AB3N13_08935 [Arenibacterium sp.]